MNDTQIVYVVLNHDRDVISPPFDSRALARAWMQDLSTGLDCSQCTIRRAKLTVYGS